MCGGIKANGGPMACDLFFNGNFLCRVDKKLYVGGTGEVIFIKR